jgi:hypothetical protein
MILQIYTIVHTLISLIAVFTGSVALFGMLSGHRLDGWTKWFLTTAVLTSVTGFFFPFHRYSRQMIGAWRWIYVVTAVMALYFNLFVLVVQAFLKIPSLHALAPTQTEQPFKLAQLTVLALSALLCLIALIRFHPERDRAA